jgi:hypothetical protein
MENNEKEKIQEAEILESKNETENIETSIEASIETSKKKKWISDFYVELFLFLILGILVGIAVKTEAMKRITIGFDDYRMKIMVQDFDINKMQIDLAEKQKQEEENKDKQK